MIEGQATLRIAPPSARASLSHWCRSVTHPSKKRRRPERVSPLLLNRSAAVSWRWGMDERQKLQSDLKRYRTLRDLIHDEPAMATLEELIRDRLRQIESGPDHTFVAT